MLETAEKAVRILLLDDHTLFRESVSRLLGSERGLEMAEGKLYVAENDKVRRCD